MFQFVALLVLMGMVGGCGALGHRQTLRSPDGRIAVMIETGGSLAYSVTVNGRPALARSALGLEFRGGEVLGREAHLTLARRTSVDRKLHHPLGKRSEVRDHYNELRLGFHERWGDSGGANFEIIVRAYDDGVALRYGMPGQFAFDRPGELKRELTEFAFAEDATAYAGGHKDGGVKGSQEWEFPRRKLSEIGGSGLIGGPLLVQTSACWIAVCESDLRDWAGMWLSAEKGKTTFSVALAPRLDAGREIAVAPSPGLGQSPWRVLMIGREPGRLIESDLIWKLAAPSAIGDASWVKPGMAAWNWWSGAACDTATLNGYIQFASDMGWPYMLIDAGWYERPKGRKGDVLKVAPQVDMPELLRFAREKNVRLWLWIFWSDLNDDANYEKAFALYEQWGIAGVKIDFMDREDQEMVQWYERICRAAAKHHLMVNFHGAMKPTGMDRTYPNQVTREGILGNEYNKWNARISPEHKLTLPFTRFLLGPGDFTPGGFLNRQPEKFVAEKGRPVEVQGTRALELALFVAYDSPVMCVCDSPEHIRGQAGADFLKVVPTVWDDTRVLEGEVGRLLTVARRKGGEWFVASMVAGAGREVAVKTDFLKGGKWKVRIWRDAADSGENAEHLEVEECELRGGEVVRVNLARNGGCVMRLQAQ